MSSSVFGATLTHLFAAERVKYDFKYDKCYYNKHYRSNSAGSYCFSVVVFGAVGKCFHRKPERIIGLHKLRLRHRR